MIVSPAFWRKLRTLTTILWMAFLCYGPVGLFVMLRFRWPILALGHDLAEYVFFPAVLSSICAFILVGFYLVQASGKVVLPLSLFLFEFTLFFSPLQAVIEARSFAEFIKPESKYIQKHCVPVNFVQDGKNYRFGICDLVIAHDGSDDFSFVYDTSGDIENYKNLSSTDRALFVKMVRKYYNDDPNAGFEYADFTVEHFYKNFYDVSFDDAEAAGFTAAYGRPPRNPKSPYEPFF